MVRRALAAALCLVAARLYLAAAAGTPAMLREPLAHFPPVVEAWTGEHAPIEQKFLDSLRLDEYINRTYQRRGGLPITLYVGYYGGMRTGNTQGPHAPMLCLPGQGWQPIKTGLLDIPMAPAGGGDPSTLTVSRFVIDNTSYRFLLLFWYQIHQRAVPTEFASKLYLFADGLAAKGTDGALVRVALPLMNREPATEQAAEREGMAFLKAAAPLLAKHFPEDAR